MKKCLLFAMAAGVAIFTCPNMFAQESVMSNRGCASMEYKEMEEKLDPSIKEIRSQIEEQTRTYIQNQIKNPTPTPHAVITIPIVFHVVYNGVAENVSDNCIAQTLIALNNDFRKLNTDFTTKTPSVFQPFGADCEIQFCMATKDPTGAPTNGITRTSTTQTSFSTNNDVKFTARGGHDVWDSKKYVNLWVCDLGSQLLGYGQFPGGSPTTDGVVCHYKYLVKTGGCGAVPFEKGRTTVHELGHYFNLYHIWGSSTCGNDFVADTPTQQGPNGGCPTFPKVTCNNGPNGDMFMNYMDYTNDACMVMFTADQKTRMTAALNGSRSGLKTSAATLCAAGTGVSDLVLTDFISIYPNPSTGDVFMNVTIPNISSADMTVYNAIGDAVLEKRIVIPSASGSDVKLDMSSNPDGMYLVKMKTSEGTITKKFVINR